MTQLNDQASGQTAASAEEDVEALSPEIKQLLESEDSPNGPKLSGALVQAVKMSIFSGPLPSPQTLAEYKEVDPELLDLIKGQAGGQMDHRMALENKAVGAEIKRMAAGQWMTGIIAVFGLAMSAAVGIWGNPATAVAIAAFAVGGPAVVRIFSANAARASSAARRDGG